MALVVGGLFTGGMTPVWATPPSVEDLQFFEAKIRPLLLEHCVDCHGADDAQSDLRLDTLDGMLGGGVSGPAVVPGVIDESLLVAAVGYDDELLQMPPDGKLAAAEIALLKDWVARGAPHPESDGVTMPAVRKSAIDVDRARQFWAFRPLIQPSLPAVERTPWVQSPIDTFVLSQLESEGLTPARPADKRTLIRRATYDLTGLPPTPEEVDAFLADDSPAAFERLIDRLLESKQYGEHWGRHWLDIVRYADSNGLDENVAHGNAWRYRDYVVRSLNADKPLDRFMVEQIAGDLLAAEMTAEPSESGGTEDDAGDTDHSANTAVSPEVADLLIATGFLTLGPKVLAEADQVKMRMDIIDEQIDTVGRAFLGLTLGCARCHDHKFDPISAADYYALAGILGSTRTMESLKTVAKWNENSIATAAEIAAREDHQAQIAAVQAEIAAVVASATEALPAVESAAGDGETAEKPEQVEARFPESTRSQLKELRDRLAKLEASLPSLPTAMGVRDEAEVADMRIHVRGSHLTLGQTVPRGIPALLATTGPLEYSADSSGRAEFAEWLVSPANPLTSRVMANRVWRWHFGRGLVGTTDNFGLLGESPTHPELLDWLASQWSQLGWSLKAMHRQIMLSSTYQMSSDVDADNLAIDPDNRHWWRSDVRRLQAEAIRDGVLAASGLIDQSMGGSMLHVGNHEFIFNHTSKDETSYQTYRRSLYLPVIRNNLYDGFSLFDYSAADVVTGDRQTSTVAPQALFMLNGELLLESSVALAERLLREEPDNDHARVDRLFRLALSRHPESAEAERVLGFVAAFGQAGEEAGTNAEQSLRDAWAAVCQSVLVCNEFIYVP